VAGWLAAVALALLPMPRSVRFRWRLSAPAAAVRADHLAGAAPAALWTGILALLGAAAWPGQHPSLRLWSVGAAIGLATGIPLVLERRGLRRRVASLPPLAEPPALGTHSTAATRAAAVALDAGDPAEAAALLAPPLDEGTDPEALRLGALLEARSGRTRPARLLALRASQLDPARWDALLDTGAALCRRGRFAEGVRLLERGVELSGRAPAALLVLAAGDATAGRLREAVSALDEAEGVSARRGR
jgi:hypothetical protein